MTACIESVCFGSHPREKNPGTAGKPLKKSDDLVAKIVEIFV